MHYVRKNTLLAAKGGCKCTPLTPPKSATGLVPIYRKDSESHQSWAWNITRATYENLHINITPILPEILQHLHMWMLYPRKHRACDFGRATSRVRLRLAVVRKCCKLSVSVSYNAILASTTFCCRIHNPSFTVSYFDLAHTTQQSFQSPPECAARSRSTYSVLHSPGY